MRRWLLAFISLALLLVRALPAAGHAAPVIMDPPGGAILETLPEAIRLQFSQPVELRFSQVEVNSGGRAIGNRSDLHLDGNRRLIYPLPPLAPGRYDVKWRVLSTDGHVTEGSYWFQIAEGARGSAYDAPGGAEPPGEGGWLLHPLVMLPLAPLLFFVVRRARKRREALW